jgi:hypothetical protein
LLSVEEELLVCLSKIWPWTQHLYKQKQLQTSLWDWTSYWLWGVNLFWCLRQLYFDAYDNSILMHTTALFWCIWQLYFDAYDSSILMPTTALFWCIWQMYFDAYDNSILMPTTTLFWCLRQLYFDAYDNFILIWLFHTSNRPHILKGQEECCNFFSQCQKAFISAFKIHFHNL